MMGSPRQLLEEGQAALRREAEAVAALSGQLDEAFADAVAVILRCEGHVIVSGAGTSAAVARRLAHLLTCVGAPAFYLSAGESAHGSAASVTPKDALIAISKGGQTDELNNLIRVARRQGCRVIAITAQPDSPTATLSDVVISYAVPKDVDGHGVIALGSSLASSAIGDAICFAVLSERGYDPEAFRRVHPGGAVGKMLSQGGPGALVTR